MDITNMEILQMNCIDGKPHNTKYEWSVNEYDALAYDVGNMNCNVKIKPSTLFYFPKWCWMPK